MDLYTAQVQVNWLNTAPAGASALLSTPEDTPYTCFTAGTFGFSDYGDTPPNGFYGVKITTLPGVGTLTLSGTLVGNGQTILAADIPNLAYTPPANQNGAALTQLTFQVQDDGGTANGGLDTDPEPKKLTIDVPPVNDVPVQTGAAPSSISVNEDSANSTVTSLGMGSLTYGPGGGADESGQSLTYTITAIPSYISLWQANGTTAVSVNDVLTLSQLQGLNYKTVANANGTGNLSWTVQDDGGTSSGGVDTLNQSLGITVSAVNDDPVNGVPGGQSTDEDTDLVFTGSTIITVEDIDAGSSSVQVSLSVSHGILTLSATSGLTFATGDSNGTPSMCFTGVLDDVIAALNGLAYTPSANYNGSDTLRIITDDLGNTGSGGAKSDTDTIAIIVKAINDAPVISVPGAQGTYINTNLVFSAGHGNLISVSDFDAGTSSLLLTLSVTHGILTLSGTSGLTFTAGKDGSASMTFSGSATNVNAALAGLTYSPATNFLGSATLFIDIDDQGNTGLGGSLTDSDSVSISVCCSI